MDQGNNRPLDCLVIGAGPAGLTAAIYLARFRLATAVIDAGHSRAAMIPRTHNHAGFPGGIPGRELLARMQAQASEFGAEVTEAEVTTVETKDGLFVARSHDGAWTARSILLATGVINRSPPMAAGDHDAAVARGLLRYCPICDGYEATDRRIAVIGSRTHGHNEALFLRMYSREVTLVAPDGQHALAETETAGLLAAGVVLKDGPCEPLQIAGETILVRIPGETIAFDTVYPALGSSINSQLAVALGARASEEGCLVVDAHQRTSIHGLYAAGDVTMGLDQISHAMGQAAVAATAIRNDLARPGRFCGDITGPPRAVLPPRRSYRGCSEPRYRHLPLRLQAPPFLRASAAV